MPQGSTLGLLLLSLYINDLPLHTNFHVNLFSDNTILILKYKNISHLKVLVNHELKIVDEWVKSNRLSSNYSKNSSFVNYSKRNKSNFLNFAVDVDGHKISL